MAESEKHEHRVSDLRIALMQQQLKRRESEKRRRELDEALARRCPKCGCGPVARILYGLPDFSSKELNENVELGIVRLGGCIVHDGDPVWFCNSCQHRWGSFKCPD